MREAIAHFTQGLAFLKTLPHTPERAQHELTLTLALGGPLAVTKGYAAPEVAQLSPVAWRLLQFYVVRGELQTARSSARSACTSLATMPPLCW